MDIRGVIIGVFLSLAAGCAAHSEPPLLPRDHPANPEAPEAALPPASSTLAATPRSSPAAGNPSVDSMNGMHHMGHGMSHDMPSMTHAAGATTSPATSQAAAIYTCVMHPEVVSHQPGKCPVCGMKLVPMAEDGSHQHGGHE